MLASSFLNEWMKYDEVKLTGALTNQTIWQTDKPDMFELSHCARRARQAGRSGDCNTDLVSMRMCGE